MAQDETPEAENARKRAGVTARNQRRLHARRKRRQRRRLVGALLRGFGVPISKIVTGHATGRTALRIGYSGLPGHSEGELAAFIQKYPLVFASQKVGVGTGSPSGKLTVETTRVPLGACEDAPATISSVLMYESTVGSRAPKPEFEAREGTMPGIVRLIALAVESAAAT